jgi:hypothetical protein
MPFTPPPNHPDDVNYRSLCIHCKQPFEDHAQGHCLFDSTSWSVMTYGEWHDWRHDLWRKYRETNVLGAVSGC